MDGIDIDQQKVSVQLAKGPKPQRAPPMRSDYRIVVENLAYSVSWQILKDHMRKAGDVTFADVVKDHNGRSKGYGIVEYRTYDDMKYAIRKLNDTTLEGSRINVREVLCLSVCLSMILFVHPCVYSAAVCCVVSFLSDLMSSVCLRASACPMGSLLKLCTSLG